MSPPKEAKLKGTTLMRGKGGRAGATADSQAHRNPEVMSEGLTGENRHLFADFAIRSLRNQADRDYITARSLFRLHLYQSFLWPALQAIEKYLKAILLLNFETTRHYGHNTASLLEAAQRLPRLGFAVPEDVRKFVFYLAEEGGNRYLDQEFSLAGDELLLLDLAVWHIRRYCQDFMLLPCDDASNRGICEWMLATAQTADPQMPTKFKIDGLLEKILSTGPVEQRNTLVWHNHFYSRRHHRFNEADLAHEKERLFAMQFEKPVHVMHPQIESILTKLSKVSANKRR